MREPVQRYIRRKEYYEKSLKKLEKSINLISNLRLIDAGAALLSFISFYKSGYINIAWITLVLYILIFAYLVIIHSREINRRKYIMSLHDINKSSILRFEDGWKVFQDTGEEFKNEGHPFSGDLDIFGKASLFQWINTAKTKLGRRRLKELLTQEAEGPEEIKKRQWAVEELSQKRWWRQRLEAEASGISDKLIDEEVLYKWAEERTELYNSGLLRFGVILLPAITVSTLFLSYGLGVIPRVVPKLLGIVHLILLFLGFNKRNAALEMVYKYKNNIRIYSSILRHFEKHSFNSRYIIELQSMLLDEKIRGASYHVKKLEKIVDAMLNRKNIMFLPINILLLWDYQIMVSLENWKKNSGHTVRAMIKVIGEMEALSSLAVINHDHPDWSVPSFSDRPSVLMATSIGHPLITRGKVTNDILMEKTSGILLITGSNMSGKTTFLRTAGINLVLAYAGSAVCASYMECSVMRVYTCMRVSDNLDKNISSFYAELLRIGEIVRASENGRQVFCLLDEIFKGTNSSDRHTGAKAVIRKLSSNGASGMVSTHDLELGELEEQSGGQVKNYHFQEYYEGNQICFDYKLRKGVSATRNALYLIRMVGIET